MRPLSIVMFAFSALMLATALIIRKGNTGLVRSMKFTKVNDKKEYARFLGNTLAMTAFAVLTAGVCGIFLPATVSVIVLAGLIVAVIIVAAKRSKIFY